MTPIDEALESLLGGIEVVPGQEAVPLEAAVGRVSAATVTAAADVPALPTSAMDGYAVRVSDLRDGAPLPVTRRIAAGSRNHRSPLEGEPMKQGRSPQLNGWGDSLQALPAGEAARIFTGAVLPKGADAVVMQEDCTLLEDGTVQVKAEAAAALTPGTNVRQAGADIAAGTEVLATGRRLQPQDAAVLAVLGITKMQVKPLLRVALLSTGDELARPGRALAPGQIYDANQLLLSSLLARLPVKIVYRRTVGDELKATRAALRRAAVKADCILSSGGVSVGEADFMRAALEQEGKLQLWRLALKPGKPLVYGTVGRRIRGKSAADRHSREGGNPEDKSAFIHFFGLPGNPVSAFVTFGLVVRPCLLAMLGCSRDALRPRAFPVAAGFSRGISGGRQEYLRVTVHSGVLSNVPPRGDVPEASQGALELRPHPKQGSAAALSLSQSDGLAIIPPATAVREGDPLDFIPFSELLS